MILKPKNWDKFQHYKDRSPPWIKLHRDLLDNRNYWNLNPVAAKYLPLIWLISSEKDGLIPDNDDLAFRLRISVTEAKQIVEDLIASQFLINASDEEVEQVATNAQALAAKNGFGSRHISDKTKRQVWDRDEGKCQDCGAVKNIEYDHIIPVSKGGGSDIDNIQLLCRPCNRKKRSKTVEQVATQSLSSRILETETETEEETEKKFVIEIPDWLPKEVWKDWCDYRKSGGKKFTDKSKALCLGKLQIFKEQGHDPVRVINNSIENGWSGLFAPKDNDIPAKPKTSMPDWAPKRAQTA